jgi:hypothetical protein
VSELSPRLRRVLIIVAVVWAVIVVGYVVLGLLALGHHGVHLL